MIKPTNLRVNKKIVFPVIVLLVLVAAFFIYRSINYDNQKKISKSIAEQGYAIKNSTAGKRVIMRIDGVNVTYGQLMCMAKIQEAYGTTSNDKNIKSGFVNIYENIAMANEVKKKMTKSKTNIQPESDTEIISYMKRVLENEINTSNDPKIAGVAEIQYSHISDDLDYYKNQRLVNNWINRNMPSSISKNTTNSKYTRQQLTDITNKANAEAEQIFKDSVNNGIIEYIDESYSYLSKSLIKVS